jgi:hypothetical protein
LSFVNFQGKLTGTSCDLFACEASLFGLLCAWREVQILRQQKSHIRFPEKGVDTYWSIDQPPPVNFSLEPPLTLPSLQGYGVRDK